MSVVPDSDRLTYAIELDVEDMTSFDSQPARPTESPRRTSSSSPRAGLDRVVATAGKPKPSGGARPSEERKPVLTAKSESVETPS